VRRAACLVLFCAVLTADWGEAEQRFKAAYKRGDTKEAAKARREAIRDVAGEDVPEAAELLLKVWGSLVRDKDKLRGELHALRTRMRQARGKLRAADSSTARKLKAQIKSLEGQSFKRDARLAGIEMENAAVLGGLRGMKSEEVIDWLAQHGLRRARAPALRFVVAQRIATSPRASAATLITALEKLRKADELVPILQALGHKDARIEGSIDPILRHLEHKDWAVRVAAAHALARAGRPEGVGALVEALQRERDRSRAQAEMVRALTLLTSQRIGPYPDLWMRWWRANASRIKQGAVPLGKGPPAPKSRGEQGHFYGIPQDADRIIYVLDKSGSMEVSMEDPRWVDGASVPAADDEDSRFDTAVRELKRAVKKLRKGSAYAVIVYSSHARKLNDKLVPSGLEEHEKSFRQLDTIGPEGSTNIYEALDLALRMANVHSEGTRGETRADAIFLVSDGSPTNAKGKTEDPERTLQAVREWNALRRIAIHTIGIGAKHSAGFMSQLASENGGEYYAVLPKKKQPKKK